MEIGSITSYMDVAQVTLYAFWIFFAGLLFYLRREDRREGYPLMSSMTGVQDRSDPLWMPDAKTFRLASGRTVSVPSSTPDARPFAASPAEGFTGSPFVPTGDPMRDGVGPANYAERPDIPDVTYEGKPRIVPLRADKSFWLDAADPDPRGMTVYGSDGQSVGTIVDAWIDRSEYLLRYVEVELDRASVDGVVRVLLPSHFMEIDGGNRRVRVGAILSSQFAAVPRLAKPDTVTLLEEERIVAYYGGGLLYATPDRQEPLL